MVSLHNGVGGGGWVACRQGLRDSPLGQAPIPAPTQLGHLSKPTPPGEDISPQTWGWEDTASRLCDSWGPDHQPRWTPGPPGRACARRWFYFILFYFCHKRTLCLSYKWKMVQSKKLCYLLYLKGCNMVLCFCFCFVFGKTLHNCFIVWHLMHLSFAKDSRILTTLVRCNLIDFWYFFKIVIMTLKEKKKGKKKPLIFFVFVFLRKVVTLFWLFNLCQNVHYFGKGQWQVLRHI